MKSEPRNFSSLGNRKKIAFLFASSFILLTCSIGSYQLPSSSLFITGSTQNTKTPTVSSIHTNNLATLTYDLNPASDDISPGTTPTVIPTSLSVTAALTPSPIVLLYYFPVQPTNAASYDKWHHDYPAADILAPGGTLFVAVTSGVVDFVRYQDTWVPRIDDPDTRGGLAISIIGDDGIRYYGSHLSYIAPEIYQGARVFAGQLLGRIGTSGNARGTSPHLHFGISHPTYPEDWEVRRGEVAPYPYLEAWLNGDLLTPVLP